MTEWMVLPDNELPAAPLPELVIWRPGEDVTEACEHAAKLIRAWHTESRLVILTRGAVVTRLGEEIKNPAGAAVWQLVRAAQPERVVLVDAYQEPASWEWLCDDEPEIAVRADATLVPRLAYVPDEEAVVPSRDVIEWPAVAEVVAQHPHADPPVQLLARLDLDGWRDRDDIPPLLRGLVPARVRRRRFSETATETVDLSDRLAGLPASERAQVLLETVTTTIAAVLGYRSGSGIDIRRGFFDLGIDSLTAMELRARLTAATGLDLPVSYIFDHPTPSALAQSLLDRLGREQS